MTNLFKCAILMVGLAVVLGSQVSLSSASLALLSERDFRYVGAFRLPGGTFGTSSFGYGGTAMAYNPARNSLFMVGHDQHQQVAEVSIPSPVNGSNVDSLPTASVLQPFADAMEGRQSMVSSDTASVKIGGLMVAGTQLFGTAWVYYDGGGTQKLTHFVRSTSLTTPSIQGPYQVSGIGAVAGSMVPIPSTWRSQLGGPALTGQCCIPILSRTSFGPSAWSFDPANLGLMSPVPATALLYYPQDHQLSTWDQTSNMFNGTTKMGGMVFPEGSSSLLYFGRQGIGPYCYGFGTTQQPVPPPAPDGTQYCYDPTDDSKGNHAYPYVYQVWAYDIKDLASVKSGAKQSWELRPYATWQLTFPTTSWLPWIKGVAYDPQHQRLWVSQAFGDGERPLVHVFDLNMIPPPSSPTSVRILR